MPPRPSSATMRQREPSRVPGTKRPCSLEVKWPCTPAPAAPRSADVRVSTCEASGSAAAGAPQAAQKRASAARDFPHCAQKATSEDLRAPRRAVRRQERVGTRDRAGSDLGHATGPRELSERVSAEIDRAERRDVAREI